MNRIILSLKIPVLMICLVLPFLSCDSEKPASAEDPGIVAAESSSAKEVDVNDGPASVPESVPEIVLQLGHSGSVQEIVITPDDHYLVSAGESLKIWELETGYLVKSIPLKSMLRLESKTETEWF